MQLLGLRQKGKNYYYEKESSIWIHIERNDDEERKITRNILVQKTRLERLPF
jgi:hypothetical protein